MAGRRLIICTDSGAGGASAASAHERDAITRHLQVKGWQVWHWFQDLWLVVTSDGTEVSLRALGGELQGLFTQPRHLLVLDAEDLSNYSGRGPPAAWPWMRESWEQHESVAATPLR